MRIWVETTGRKKRQNEGKKRRKKDVNEKLRNKDRTNKWKRKK